MRVLVTGGSGLLGRYLLNTQPRNIEAAYTWYTRSQPWTDYQLDVCDKSMVSYVVGRVQPDAIIHMAAAGNVDWCENNYREAWRCNVEGTENVLAAAADYGAKVLLTSTNAVFDGENPPYQPDAERNPVNSYGRMRRKAEDLFARYKGEWQVARLFLLYGWEPPGARGNWGSDAVRRLRRGVPMRVVDDITYQPTYAGDAARALWWLVTDYGPGYYHLSGGDTLNLHAFVLKVAETWGYDKSLISAISMSQLAHLKMAPRPRDSSYVRTNGLGLVCRGVDSGLASMHLEWLQGAGGGLE